MKHLIFVIVFLTLAVKLNAQGTDSSAAKFTGNLTQDSRAALKDYEATKVIKYQSGSRKSPLLAGVMSMLLPGAGEVYAGSYWKAAAFVAIEAVAITAAVAYNKKGDEATVDFQNYANAHWSPVRYAEWLNRFATELTDGKVANNYIQIDNTSPGKQPWERVDFGQINFVERNVPTFSHVLPPWNNQQYYELIGKYHEFNHGWDAWDQVNPAQITAEYLDNLPAQFDEYAAMHILPDKTYYKYASRAVTAIVINHLLSAIDAAWSASSYNKNLAINMEVKPTNFAGFSDYHPQLNIRYSF